MLKGLIILISSFSFSAQASLWFLGFNSQSDKNVRTTGLSLSQSLDVKKNELGLSKWGVSGSRTQSKSDPEDSSSEIFNSTFFNANVAAQYKAFDFSLNANSNQTKEVDYKASDLGLGVGYKWSFHSQAFKKSKEEDVEDFPFIPSLRLGLNFSEGDVEQEFSITILNRTYYRTFSMKQKNSGLDLTYSALEWLSLGLGYKKYTYDRDTSDIQTAVNSRFVNYYAGDLTTTLAGLLESSSYFSTDFYFNQDWDLNLTHSQNTLLVDESKTQTSSLIVGYNFTSGLRLEAGGSSYKSDSTKETSAIFDMSYIY